MKQDLHVNQHHHVILSTWSEEAARKVTGTFGRSTE